MASSRDSSADSKRSYDSTELYRTNGNKFDLSDEMKMHCLEGLHCSQAKKKKLPAPKGGYSTWTSRWVRNKTYSFYAYTLLKVKRWYLVDENFLFDPLKMCNSNAKLTPDNTLWRTLPGNSQPHCESKLSVDGILSVKFNYHVEVKKAMKTLDCMLEPLDQALSLSTKYEAITLYHVINERASLAQNTFCKEYCEFVQFLSHAIIRNVITPKGGRVSEKVYEDAFMYLVTCLNACIGGAQNQQVHCYHTVDGFSMEKISVPVELKSGKPKTLEISSRPDLFLYHRTNPVPDQQRTVVAVVEAKGQKNGEPVHSDDDCDECDECDEATPSPEETTEKCMQRLTLDTLDEEDDNDDDDHYCEIEETALELLVNNTRDWLRNTRTLPPLAQLSLKKFLPQLIGEMFCASRSENMKALRSKNGLLFGIGLVGFEVYFVTVLDTSRDSSYSVVNSESAFTNVFVTRPFNLLLKKDRRVILKTLAASFTLHESLSC